MFQKNDAMPLLFSKYPDKVRHPLINESEDWEKNINPALQEFGTYMTDGYFDHNLEAYPSLVIVCRVLMETIYVAGYQRGLREAKEEEIKF